MDGTVVSKVPIDSPEIRLDRLYRDLGENKMNRQEALDILKSLSETQLEAICIVINTAEIKWDYNWDRWEDDVDSTLCNVETEIVV